MRLVIDTFEFGSVFTPRFNTISISGYHIREAGSTAVQEVAFTIADAMFAPVVTRFRTYRIELEREAEAYCETIMAMPAMQEWIAAAKNEPMIVEAFEF